MKSSSDNFHKKFKALDFADAKPVSETTHLAKLQAQSGNKTRITMRVDSDVLAIFKARAGIICLNFPFCPAIFRPLFHLPSPTSILHNMHKPGLCWDKILTYVCNNLF